MSKSTNLKLSIRDASLFKNGNPFRTLAKNYNPLVKKAVQKSVDIVTIGEVIKMSQEGENLIVIVEFLYMGDLIQYKKTVEGYVSIDVINVLPELTVRLFFADKPEIC